MRGLSSTALMRSLASLALLVAAAGGAAGCSGEAAASHALNVSGSTTVLPIVEIAAEDFMKAHPGTDVLVSGIGSSAGIEAVAAGTAEIGTSSRDLKDEEKGLGLVDTPLAYDGIAVIVNPANPVKNLSMSQLRDIFGGRITNWAQVGGLDRPIDLVNRDEASGTREAFKKLVMGDVPFDRTAAVLPGTGQVRDVVSRATGAVGYISFGFVASRYQTLPVKALSIDGEAPTPQSIGSKKYPIGRVLHLFTKGPPTGLAKEFIDYLLSPKIQDTVVVDAGFLPIASVKGASQE